MNEIFRKYVRVIMLVIVLTFVISIFFMYGSSGRGSSSDGMSGDHAVATINGQNVMHSTIDMELMRWVQDLQNSGYPFALSDDEIPWIRTDILDQMAINAEMLKEIAARGITATDQEVDEEYSAIVRSYPTREIFMQAMARDGVSEKELKAGIADRIRSEKIIRSITDPVSVDEIEKSSFYETFKDYRFKRRDAFLVSRADFSTRAAANAMRAAYVTSSDWELAVSAASQDILYRTYGDEKTELPISDLTGAMYSINNLQMGEISYPIYVKSDDYAIIIKHERQYAGVDPYDSVSEDIANELLMQKRQGARAQFIQELRSRADVKILDQSLFKTFGADLPIISGDVSADISADAVAQQ